MQKKFESLQRLRALAALLVVADHSIYFVCTKENLSPVWHNLSWHLGTIGVDIFFVISGFIMIYTSESLFGSAFGAARFAYRRSVRIVPMYWLATCAEIVLMGRRGSFPPTDNILSSLFFFPYVAEPGLALRPILGVGWTLNHEMMFYALFACSLIFNRRQGLLIVTGTLITLVALGAIVKPLSDTQTPTTVITFLCNPIMLLFAAGVLLGMAWKRFKIERFRFRFGGAASVAAMVSTVLVSSIFVDQVPWPISWQSGFWAASIIIVALTLIARPATRRPATFELLERLGDASYSIYLFHFMIIAAWSKLVFAVFGATGWATFVCSVFVVAVAGGWLVHVCVERPLLRFLKKGADLFVAAGRAWHQQQTALPTFEPGPQANAGAAHAL